MSGIVKPEPYHKQVYNQFQDMLFKREYKPGERITEVALAEKLGISRGPIREAIRMLLHDGLLIQEGNHINVFDPSFDDVIDLYLCKERLEPLAASLACDHITKASKEKLGHILDSTEEALKQQQPSEEIADLNTEFHHLIIHASQNAQLIQFMEMIRSKNRYMRINLLDNYTRKGVFLKEHRQIAEAIIAGDEKLAEQAMKNHVQEDLRAWELTLK